MTIPLQIQGFEDGRQECRSDVHSHYLVQNNCIEKVNCANFEELANTLKEDLVELSSGQLIIKLLEKELNTILVLGSEHNLRSEAPLLHREFVNQQTTRCGRKVMRLAKLCTNRQCCCLPLHMAVRLTLAVDSVQF